MRKLLEILVVVGCLGWLPLTYAEGAAVPEKQVPAVTQQVEKKPQQHEGHGFSVFWVVFIVAILFVLSSATALNSLGGKPPPRSGNGATPKPKKTSSNADPKDRFRL